MPGASCPDSQGRIKLEYGRAKLKYEYRHELIPSLVQRDVQRGHIEEYSVQDVQEALNRQGADGWELVSMEPKWVYRSSSYTGEAVEPDFIECWYATFKRPLEH